MSKLSFADLERVYDEIAESIDAVGEAATPHFLAKLCLILANETGDRDIVSRAIAACRDEPSGRPPARWPLI